MNLFRLIFAFFLLLPLSACALSCGPISGKVLEEGTDKPIPGAIVAVRWVGRTTSGSIYVEAQSTCYHVESATTDERGAYQTKAWNQEQHKDYKVKFDHMLVSAYKAGYGYPQTPTQREGIVYLAPFKGSSGERLKYLERLSEGTHCDEASERAMNRLPLEKAIYEEARALARTSEEKKNVETLLFGLESMEYGSMEALKRLTERRSKGQ